MKTNNIPQKIFGILSSLYLLYGAVLCGYTSLVRGSLNFYKNKKAEDIHQIT